MNHNNNNHHDTILVERHYIPRNIYNQIIAGTRLQPAQRQEYVNAMKESAKTQFDQLKPVVSQYENIAKNNKVGFDDIMPTHYRSFEPKLSATAAAFIP